MLTIFEKFFRIRSIAFNWYDLNGQSKTGILLDVCKSHFNSLCCLIIIHFVEKHLSKKTTNKQYSRHQISRRNCNAKLEPLKCTNTIELELTNVDVLWTLRINGNRQETEHNSTEENANFHADTEIEYKHVDLGHWRKSTKTKIATKKKCKARLYPCIGMRTIVGLFRLEINDEINRCARIRVNLLDLDAFSLYAAVYCPLAVAQTHAKWYWILICSLFWLVVHYTFQYILLRCLYVTHMVRRVSVSCPLFMCDAAVVLDTRIP